MSIDTPQGVATPDQDHSGEAISLADVAERLGVHYMTAYRYVRTGRLRAIKRQGMWWVDEDDLASLDVARLRPSANSDTGRDFNQLSTRLRIRLEAGDDAGAWTIVNEALASGVAASEVHLRIIGPAMVEIGESWARGETSIATEHRATAAVQRVLGRMTTLFRRPGRRSMSAILGCVQGDRHGLSTAMLADLLCDAGVMAHDLGADTPADSFVELAESIDGPLVVGLACAVDDLLPSLEETVSELRRALPHVRLVAGGAGCSAAIDLQVDAIARSGEQAVELMVAQLAGVQA